MKRRNSTDISEPMLSNLYIRNGLSMQEIAGQLGCSLNKVDYWMRKYGIERRSRSDATYLRNHPNGDPFKLTAIDTSEKAMLYGLGIGLYWGEGTKANQHAIRLGNTDPALLRKFMKFLIDIYGVSRDDLRFGLQIFTDINAEEALDHWATQLGVKRSQFYKIHITKSGSIGTYRSKSQYGVVTLYYHNKKLRDILVNALPR